MTLAEQLVDAWRINAEINRYLLDAIPDHGLAVSAPTGGRTVGDVFAHLHNVRVMWIGGLDAATASVLTKVERDQSVDRAVLLASLDASSEGVASVLASAIATGKVKGFKPHAAAFLGYLISHESHHRGQILIALKGEGVKVPRTIAYGLWEWGSRAVEMHSRLGSP